MGEETAPAANGHRPLLKWPGGKSSEWPRIRPLLPTGIRHFVDPFMGGGAPFARTPFRGEAYLNDRHAELVALHRLVQSADAAFLSDLDAVAADWARLADVADTIRDDFAARIADARQGSPARTGDSLAVAQPVLMFHRRAASGGTLADYVVRSILDKARRVPRLEQRHGVTFTREQLDEHAETAVRAGYYTLIRAHGVDATGVEEVADFLFVREYCYGSMFRRNKNGVFNIPYGGSSYNSKQFAPRVAQLRSDATRAALSRAHFHCGDFDALLTTIRPELGPEDFVFCDPPYHSDFSTYGEHAFGLADHERLAAALAQLPCRWMLVIKETDDVRRIYLSDAARAAGARVAQEFGKQYGYNVRGRNVRATQHLVITNYDPSAVRPVAPPPAEVAERRPPGQDPVSLEPGEVSGEATQEDER